MILFLDTSALVKLFQVESGTPAVIEWVRTAERINLLDIARLEFMSVLQRRLRNQELTQADFHLLQEGFQERWSAFSIQPLNRKVVDEAEQLLLKYGGGFGLRTAGVGSRLRPHTHTCPKPLLPVPFGVDQAGAVAGSLAGCGTSRSR